MTTQKIFKYILGIIIILSMGALISYLMQILLLTSIQSTRSVPLIMLLMLAGALSIILINVLLYLLNRRNLWLEETDGLIVICTSSVLYAVFMWLIFQHITVPYELIPSAEMGFGFLQLLLQIFNSLGAGACVLAAIIRLLILKSNQNSK
ncbi:hypothetical protein SAMN06297422_12469 [Lachnospiraceae bacterium]|nr:hypothetical protein SAMN06297422_12469 [Lachnospiraceae bacterium]